MNEARHRLRARFFRFALHSGLAIGCMLLTGPIWGDGSASYTLSFSQISAGGAKTASAAYASEETLRYAQVDGESQRSVAYASANALGTSIKANNGIVIADGTKVHIEWPDARHLAGQRFAQRAQARGSLAGVQGYNVWRSYNGENGDYSQINGSLVLVNYYDDEYLTPGTYYYRVDFIDAQGKTIAWMDPMQAVVIANSNPVRDWSIYE